MAKRKLRVGVIFGWQSGAHEGSLAGAASVLAPVDRERFEAVPIGITREGRWLMGGDPLQALSHDAARRALAEGGVEASVKQELAARAGDATGTTALARMESSESLPAGLRERLDVVWIMLHGPRGEDGTLQGLLELAGVPYVGAGVLASAVGMDKAVQKTLFAAAGLPVMAHQVVHEREWEEDAEAVEARAADLGYPLFAKPATLGSSIGITKVTEPGELQAAIEEALRHSPKAVLERSAEGAREIECAVLGNDDPVASLPGEIVP